MPHLVSPNCQDNARCSRVCILLAAAAAAGLLLGRQPLDAAAQEPSSSASAPPVQAAADVQNNAPAAEKNKIVKISGQQAGKNLEITIYCSRYPSYDDHKLPGKIALNITAAEAESSAELSSALLAFKMDVNVTAKEQSLLLEFSLSDSNLQHTVARQRNNIVLTVANFFPEAQSGTTAIASVPSSAAAPLSIPAPAQPKDAAKQQEAAPATSSIEAHLPTNPLKSGGSAASTSSPAAAGGAPAVKAPFGGAGSGELITVDFYKVDLHNVFRLLGEISGYNIIVSEGVSGTLTLALHEVPWDFVLDIILNLKDLDKEQRHNTIVIYPKNKEFVWPQRSAAETALSIEPEGGAKKSGPLVVIGQGGSEGKAAPPEATEAKKFVALGIRAEKEGSLETAVQLYEKAFDLWPDKLERPEKSKLANKIASIYLVQLNQNAKAVHYAKKALAADKKNSSAALNAAIGHANMEEHRQAQQYFDQSISGGKPSREALFSYAVFSERQGQHDAALRLLGKYSELYGEDLDSMVSRGRILDQQGRKAEADQVYTAILHAGFSVPPDLRAFIVNRARSN
ncbi:MAG: hypothetical protein ACTFAL_11050 [Candidatus Electronema sp. V4]|uniref:hypothetical protein n=1 Tax=Candidatus Electronema sp. V4 TaxID=3454756 RepID=UPI004055412C